MPIWDWSFHVFSIIWVLYALAFIQQHIRVRRARVETAETREGELRAPRSMAGLLLEGVGFVLVGSFRRAGPPPAAEAGAALVVAGVSMGLAWWAVGHLGRQWRIKAVVTRDHELVTSGPYSLVRHPIYASLFGMLVSTGLLVSRWEGLVIGAAIFLSGTEIRVRAEDGILGRRFGAVFQTYQARVKAYLPLVR